LPSDLARSQACRCHSAQATPAIAPTGPSTLAFEAVELREGGGACGSKEVGNALQTSPSGGVIVLALFGLLLVAAAVLARPGGPLDSAAGLARAPGFLPPTFTVLPRVMAVRGARRARHPRYSGLVGRRVCPLPRLFYTSDDADARP